MTPEKGSTIPRATSHRARAPGQLWTTGALLLLLAGAACQPAAPSPTLRAGSVPAAERLVTELLDASVARAGPKGLCDATAQGASRAAAAIGELTGYHVDKVEPAWVGAEPYFRVDVTLKRAAGEERRSVAVRAREGCVERLWGAPLPAAIRPDEGELSL